MYSSCHPSLSLTTPLPPCASCASPIPKPKSLNTLPLLPLQATANVLAPPHAPTPNKKKIKKIMFFSFPCITVQFLLLLLLVPTYSAPCPGLGSNATSIYDALSDNALPRGLFPEGVKDFGFGADGRFWVHLDQACNAKFESQLHYDRNVSGSLSCGKIDSLTGIEAQDLFLWLPVLSIRVDVPSSGLIYIDVGAASKKFAVSLFEKPPECVAVLPEDGQGALSAFGDVSERQSGRFRYQVDQETSGRDVL